MKLSFLLFLGGIGGWEVILIVLLVVLLFGAKRIPELARRHTILHHTASDIFRRYRL